MFYTYVIQNSEGKIYIGQTEDLGKRLERHNGKLISKKGSYTKNIGGTWKLVYKEEYQTRQLAMRREKELKSYRGREFIRNQLGR